MNIKEGRRKKLGQLLVEMKIVSESQINEAIEVQKTNGKALGDILIDLGYTTSGLIMSVLGIARKTEQQLANLFNASTGMLQCTEQASLFRFIITEAERILEADMCNLLLIDEKTFEFKCFFLRKGTINEIRMPLRKGIAGYVAKTAESVTLEDAYHSPLFDPQIDKDMEYKTKTILCIPVKHKDSKVIGVLQVVNKKGRGLFTPHDEWLLKSFAICASEAIFLVNNKKEIAPEARFTENMKMFNLAVENLSEGVIIITQDEETVVVNPAAKWMLGIRINRELDKKNTRELLNELKLENVSGWLNGEVERPVSQEITLKTPETRIIKVDFEDTNIDSTKGKKGCIVVFKDITRDKEFDQMRSEFITTASHELLSPITSMKNAVNIMLQGILGPNTESQEKFLRIISDGVEYISYLTTTLMDIALLETRKIPLKKEKVDLSKVIKSSIDGMRFKAEENNITVLNNNGHAPPVMADANRIKQTLLNLLDNACKFTPHGSEIIVDAKTTEKEVEVSVKDNGPGIILEEQDKIFERFYQIDNSETKNHYGIGLGLSICKDIVEAHGGKIWVESKEREGSNFVFTLPLYK